MTDNTYNVFTYNEWDGYELKLGCVSKDEALNYVLFHKEKRPYRKYIVVQVIKEF